MAGVQDDNTASAQNGGTTGGGDSFLGGVLADAAAGDDSVKVVIPDETKQKFPDLVKMIMESKSMNNQERNYWMQVLPVMTTEQVSELKDILETEIRKLAEIEKKYGKNPPVKKITPEEIAQLAIQKRKEREERAKKEQEAKKKENPEDLLADLGV